MFVEITPQRRAADVGTGVHISRSDRNGIVLTIAGPPRAALGLAAGTRLRILHDPDPALPRLRLVPDPEGKYAAVDPPGRKTRDDGGGSGSVLVRMGRVAPLAGPAAARLACTWEPAAGQTAIDIDLPREFRASTAVSLAAPHGRTNQVTLGGGTPVKERV